MLTQRAAGPRPIHPQRRIAPHDRRGRPDRVAHGDPRRGHPAEPLRPVRGRRRRRRGHRRSPRRLATSSTTSPTRRRGARAPSRPVRLHRREGDRDRRTSRRARSSDAGPPGRHGLRDRMKPEERASLLEVAIPGLTDRQADAAGLDAPAGPPSARRRRGSSTPPSATELRDTRGRRHPRDESPAAWAATSMRPSGCWRPRSSGRSSSPNSSFSQTLTDQAKDRAAENVQPVEVDIAQGEVVVRNGTPLTAADLEAIQALGLGQDAPLDVTTLAGWFLLSVLTVTILLAWIWRFRPDALAPRQRPAADRTAVRRRLGRVEGDRRSRAARLLPSDRRDRDGAHDPARRVGRDDRHGARRASSAVPWPGRRSSSPATSSSEASRASWPVRKGDRLQTFVQAGIACSSSTRRGLRVLATRDPRHPRCP